MDGNFAQTGTRPSWTRAAARLRVAVSVHPVLTRWLLAGPGVIVAALLFTMSMAVWFPAGAAGVNHIGWPMILAPLTWGLLFTYACLEEDLYRGTLAMAGIAAVCGLLSGLAVMGWG